MTVKKESGRKAAGRRAADAEVVILRNQVHRLRRADQAIGGGVGGAVLGAALGGPFGAALGGVFGVVIGASVRGAGVRSERQNDRKATA